MKIALSLLFAFLYLASPASAQYFGQNKVQYETHEWSIIETPNFLVYFHDGEKRVALDTARMAERAYTRLSQILNHEIHEPVPLILHASHAEFQVSHVSPGLISEGTGGYTEFLKRRIAMPVTGDYSEVDHVLTHELVHAFQLDLLSHGGKSVGGGLRWVPPLWVMEGMAEYLSTGHVDELTEMWLRDGALEGYLLPITVMDRVGDIRVYRYGQAIMAYIGNSFGDEKVGEFFKKMTVTRSVPAAAESALGITLEKLSENFIREMRVRHLPTIADHKTPDQFAFQLTHSERELSNVNLSPAVSPEGDHVVFFSDRSLYNDLYLASAVDGTVEKRLVKGERNPDFESLRYFRSTADWAPDGKQICFAALSGGRDAIYIQRIRDEKIVQKLRLKLDGIGSPSFSPDGEWITFSGMDDGSSNLYRVRIDGTGLEQLTDDRFMVREPRYSNDGARIAYVTDRGPDTDFERLLFSDPVIAIYDLASGRVDVLPDQDGINISPHFFPGDQFLLFVSNRTGISNVYLRDLRTGEDRQITDILTGVSGIIPTGTAITLSRNGKRMVFSSFSRGSLDLFALKNPLDLWDEGVVWKGRDELVVQSVDEDSDDTGDTIETGDADTSLPTADPDSPAGESAVLAEGIENGDDDSGQGPEVEPVNAEASLFTAVSLEEEPPPQSDESASETAPDLLVPDEDSGLSTVRQIGSENETTDPEVAVRLDSLWNDVQSIGPENGALLGESNLPLVAREADNPRDDEIVVADVFADNIDLPDPSSFKINAYKSKFSADFVSANGFFANNVGLSAQSVLQFSDVLGTQNILVGADVYGSFRDSNLFLGYTNRKRRTNWTVSAFQYRNDFFIYAAEDRDDFVSQIYRGVNASVLRPFNRFQRIEASISGLAVAESVYRGNFYSTDRSRPDESGTLYYVQPGLAIVTDNTLYGYTGPISGGRERFAYDVTIGDLQFRTALADVRRYYNLRQQYALAIRVVVASSDGRDPQFYRIGGPYTIRGYEFGEFRGTKIGMANIEFRFPLIEQLRLGWPLPLALQGVRGAIFFDLGAAWTQSEKFKAFQLNDGVVSLRDLRGSYGLSTSMNLGFTVLKWDLSWRTDLSRNLGKPKGTISLGLDY